MRLLPILVLPLALVGTPALAQRGATPSVDSHKLDGPEGDPNGAIRALGSPGAGGSKQIVKVPNLGGEAPQRAGGPPPGTSGPR